MDQIASLSKRLDPLLTCKVEFDPEIEMIGPNYWRTVRRLNADLLLAMSPATFTKDVVDPALNAIAVLLNKHESVKVGKLPLPPEGDAVVGWVSAGGKVPIRMLMAPSGEETVVVFDILAKMT